MLRANELVFQRLTKLGMEINFDVRYNAYQCSGWISIECINLWVMSISQKRERIIESEQRI